MSSLCLAACASGNYAPVVYHQYGDTGTSLSQEQSSETTIASSGDPSMHTAGVGKVQMEPLGITGATLPPPVADAAPSSAGPIEAEQPHSIVPQPMQQTAQLDTAVGKPLPPVQSASPTPAPKSEEPPLVTAQDFAPAAASAPSAPQTIIVKPGETLFSVGRTYRVSRQAVIAANNLQPPYALKIGSRLIIPSGDASAATATASAEPPAPTAAPVPLVTAAPAPQSVPSSAPVTVTSSITAETSVASADTANRTHVVKAGETVASISRTEKVRFSQLIKLNKLAEPYHLKVGQQLKLVDGAEIGIASKQETKAPVEIHTAEAKPAPAPAHAEGGPLLHLGETPIAPASAPRAQREQHASIAPTLPKSEFIWPVSGRILSAFGPKDAGRRNDGVNIATPIGTAVRAARAGEVIYVGNELRGYGNLVLIRHDDGYVSAYAHNSRVLVARGAFVQQGQEIAESGESGSVDVPQVHFEIRKDRKPIDPLEYLPKA